MVQCHKRDRPTLNHLCYAWDFCSAIWPFVKKVMRSKLAHPNDSESSDANANLALLSFNRKCVLFHIIISTVIQLGLMNCCEQDWVYSFSVTRKFSSAYWTRENYGDTDVCGLKWAPKRHKVFAGSLKMAITQSHTASLSVSITVHMCMLFISFATLNDFPINFN